MPWAFFLLVIALSIPFWLLGAATGIELLPHLPVSALGAFCPALAAVILVYREKKAAGVIALLRRSVDYSRIPSKAWYVPIVLLMPAVILVAYWVMRALGMPLPTPRFALLPLPFLFVVFFITGLGEELGWSGYAIDPLQARWTALGAGILVGLFWAVWHLIPLAQAHRAPSWVAWWCLTTVAMRVILVWLYNNTGKSVFAAALHHAMQNVSWQLFPNSGSHYAPSVIGPILVVVVAIVTAAWGHRTLARSLRAPVVRS